MRFPPLLLLTACVDRGAWDGVPVDRAWLEEFHLSRVDVVIGFADGDALLVFEGPGGVDAVPVHLGGGGVGVVFDVAIDPEGHAGVVEIDLSDVERPTVGDVFGTYTGAGFQGALIVGGSARSLKNGRGASFREDHFAVGLGVFAGFEWVVLKEGGDDGRLVEPTTVAATGTTGGTGLPATEETGPITVDTGGGGSRSGGCGCGDGGDGGDGGGARTGDTGATSPTETTTDGTTTSATEDDEAEGCEGDGCLCTHGALSPVGAVWAGVLLRRRVRRART